MYRNLRSKIRKYLRNSFVALATTTYLRRYLPNNKNKDIFIISKEYVALHVHETYMHGHMCTRTVALVKKALPVCTTRARL